jgi:hypothetical protein
LPFAEPQAEADKFRIELDKQILDNRGFAGELLLRRAEKIKMRFGEDIHLKSPHSN